MSVVDALVLRRQTVNGVLTSLWDLGYNYASVDDGWQECGAGVNGSFHDPSGHAIINTTRFPDVRAWTDYAHSKGVLTGWYRKNDGVSMCVYMCSDGFLLV